MKIEEAIHRYNNLMKSLIEMGLPTFPFSVWLKVVNDFDKPLKNKL